MNTAYDTAKQSAALETFADAEFHFEQLVLRLAQSSETFALDSDGLEDLLNREGRELLRLLLQAHYDQRADSRVVDIVHDDQGNTRTYTRSTSRSMISRFGVVHVRRISHCRDGFAQLSPLDADLNLASRKSSRHVSKLICEHARELSFENTQHKMEQITGVKIGNRQLEEICADIAQDFSTFYEQCQIVEVESAEKQLILSCDGKGVTMIERDLRPATRKKARKKREEGSSRKRHLKPGEKRDRKRMAMVTTVYDHEPTPRTATTIMKGSKVKSKRPRPENKRVWADLERSMQEVVDDLFEEAKRRDPEGKRQWAVLLDGDPRQMKAVTDRIDQLNKAGFKILVVLDIIHVAEYLWKAANALWGSTSDKRDDWVRQQLFRLLEGNARAVAHGLGVSAGRKKLKDHSLKIVRKSAQYIENNLNVMHYHDAIKIGLPIATGVIEGACRHLVNDRLGITGARWSLTTAQAILQLRALHSSGDWDEYWQWHKQKSYDRDHASRYAEQTPPKPIYTAPREHLRLIK